MQVWIPTFCRSTLGFYDALAGQLGRPLRVCVGRSGMGQRGAIGFAADEFAHLDIVDVSGGDNVARRVLNEKADWPQIFGVYQSMPHIRRTIHAAIDRGCRVGIASEAPCNMDPPGLRRSARALYLHHIAPRRFAKVIAGAEFIINWSGDDAAALVALGWSESKIIPCGYFPPPLLRSSHSVRSLPLPDIPHILCTGSLTWHRGPDVLMRALVLLKSWGIAFRATFTGSGPLDEQLRSMAARWEVDCAFVGSLPMKELIEHYQSCTLFVAPGRQEPWGMRVNDALNCGAPSIVSRGMGACKLLLEYGLGTTFRAGDAVDLAWQIRNMLENPSRYRAVVENAFRSQDRILPQAAAATVARRLEAFDSSWVVSIAD